MKMDHEPLVSLFSNKILGQPPCVLRFRLRLDRFDYQIRHVPGKLLYTADYQKNHKAGNPAYQAEDPSCSKVKVYIKSGWPRKQLF